MHQIIRLAALCGLVGGLMSLAGCVTVGSTKNPTSAKRARGMIYRMPLQWIRVSLTVAQGKRSITVEPTTAFADTTAVYVAQFTRSIIANDDFILSVDENGLLNSEQKFTTDSQLVTGLSKLAEARASISTNVSPGDHGVRKSTPCDADGLYVWDLDPGKTAAGAKHSEPLRCNVHVETVRLGLSPVTDANTPYVWPTPVKSGASANGLFYRQAQPFEVRVFDDTGTPPLVITKVLALPTKDSPVGFIPIASTVFAKNETKIAFKSGMPTTLTIDQESEWLALATAPATVVNAYVKAVTDGFKSRGATLDEQAKYLDSLSKVKAQEAKTAACVQELAKPAPDSAQVNVLCGSK